MFGSLFQKTERQREKESQLSSLLVSFHGNQDFRPHRPDAAVYEVLVRNNGQVSTLTIRIPEKFPDFPPDIVVSAGMLKTSGHAWVGLYGQIKGSQKLRDWNKATSSLAEIVKEIVAALEAGFVAPSPALSAYPLQQQMQQGQGRASLMPPSVKQLQQMHQAPPVPVPVALPPQPQTQPQGSVATGSVVGVIPSFHSPSSSTSSSSRASPNGSHGDLYAVGGGAAAGSTSASPSVGMARRPSCAPKPEIPESFPQLRHLTEVQLERVLNDPVALAATLNNFVGVDSLLTHRDHVNSKCIALAKSTLEKDSSVLEPLLLDLEAAREEMQRLADRYNAALDAKQKLFMTDASVRDAAERHVRVLEAASAKGREILMAGLREGAKVQDLIKVCVYARVRRHAVLPLLAVRFS